MTTKYINTNEETAQSIKINDEITIDGETFKVKAKYVTRTGAEIELEKREDFQTTIELDLEEAINTDKDAEFEHPLDDEIVIQ